MYGNAFSSLKTITPEVIYPGIDIAAYVPLTEKEEKSLEVRMVKSSVSLVDQLLGLFTDAKLLCVSFLAVTLLRSCLSTGSRARRTLPWPSSLSPA